VAFFGRRTEKVKCARCRKEVPKVSADAKFLEELKRFTKRSWGLQCKACGSYFCSPCVLVHSLAEKKPDLIPFGGPEMTAKMVVADRFVILYRGEAHCPSCNAEAVGFCRSD